MYQIISQDGEVLLILSIQMILSTDDWSEFCFLNDSDLKFSFQCHSS